jgi:hypothetical protein
MYHIFVGYRVFEAEHVDIGEKQGKRKAWGLIE